MKIKTNPFASDYFENIWISHFKPALKKESFNFIVGVKFYKSGILPLFTNIGRNLTKGNFYIIDELAKDFKSKVFLIYDVPTYFNVIEPKLRDTSIGFYSSKQYPGYLINLREFDGLENYLSATFGKSSRMKFRKYQKKLESCFEISSKMYFGIIAYEDYQKLMERFMELLIKRYDQKEVSYNNMHPQEWNFYKEVAYTLILENKASLFVIYDGLNPIAITYSYHSDTTIFDAITVFDIDYAKFNIGYYNNLQLLGWCFAMQIEKLDFSKGFFDYKKRMGNMAYDFEYHIYYDKSSMVSKSIAWSIKKFFKLKYYLRKKEINEKLHTFTFWLKNLRTTKQSPSNNTIKILEAPNTIESNELVEISYQLSVYSFLKKPIYDLIYLHLEGYNNLKVYNFKNKKNSYLIQGKKFQNIITINN